MKKYIVWLLAVVLLAALPVAAQDNNSGWTAWLFDAQFGEVRLVTDTGATLDRFQLPLAQAFNAYGPNIVVSPTGGYVVYTAYDSTTNEANVQLFVYDRALQSIVAIHPLLPYTESTSIDILPTPRMFNEEAYELALGFVVGPNPSSAVPPGWEVIILNYRSDTVIASMSVRNPAAPDVGEFITPVIIRNQPGAVTFAIVDDPAPEYETFVWQTEDDTVTSDGMISLEHDVLLASGEMIYPVHDARLPALSDDASNALVVIDATGGERGLFYASESHHIIQAKFVQNGERLLVAVAETATGPVSGWVLIDRDGTEVSTFDLPPDVTQVYMTPNGFVYLAEGLTAVTTRGDGFVTDTRWASDPGNPLQLVHVQSLAPAPAEYMPWAQLVDPLE